MNLKKLVINSLFLAIGAILHQITPPIVLGMKPDFSLAMMFIIMVLNEDYRTCMITGIAVGIISAATTGFPGGQIPNFIDKIVTANVMYVFLFSLRKVVNNQVLITLTTAVGTIVSGVVFLGSAFIMMGLPASFKVLVISVVVPATLINSVTSVLLFNVINAAIRRSGIKVQ